ncbi:unnamed protein product, partial [Prorocentrum cordatum]
CQARDEEEEEAEDEDEEEEEGGGRRRKRRRTRENGEALSSLSCRAGLLFEPPLPCVTARAAQAARATGGRVPARRRRGARAARPELSRDRPSRHSYRPTTTCSHRAPIRFPVPGLKRAWRETRPDGRGAP